MEKEQVRSPFTVRLLVMWAFFNEGFFFFLSCIDASVGAGHIHSSVPLKVFDLFY